MGVAMLKLISKQAEAGPASAATTSVARPAGPRKVYDTQAEYESVATFAHRALTELALAERRVPEINAHVELQRDLIKRLADAGKDITSAETMLDSLLLSLFLAAEDRHRLRALLKTRTD